VFTCGGSNRNLSDLPRDFRWNGRRFVLRGVALHGGAHFTCVMRHENGWLHYDGMEGQSGLPPKFTNYSIDEENRGMRGRKLIKCCLK
jgi:hypothetical protein